MDPLQHTFAQQTTRRASPARRRRRWIAVSIAVFFSAGLTAATFAQNDDPDNLTVPDGLKSATEKTAQPREPSDPDAPRLRIPDDARQVRIVGELVEVDGNTLIIRIGNEQRTFRVPSGVKVLRDDKPVSVAQLQPKDTIRIERGVAPDSVLAVVAVSPAPSGEREPDVQLRSQRRQEADQEPRARVVQEAAPTAGGRVWVVLLESNTEIAESGLRPGDVIVVANRSMLQGEGALEGLSAGLFPLRTNEAGEVIISPNAAGVGVLGTGAAVPTGVNIGVGTSGTNIDPRSGGVNNPNTAIPPRSSVGDDNFGPPIGRRQNPEDRNFGPSSDPANRNFGPDIGTGNNPNPDIVPNRGAGQQAPQTQQPQQAPPAP